MSKSLNIDLEGLSLSELKSLQKDVGKAIESWEKRKKAEALAAAEAAAQEAGFRLQDLVGSKSTGKQSLNPPRYRNPADPSQTWSGRGRQPAWYKELLEEGKHPADLEI